MKLYKFRKFRPTNFDLKACNQTLTPLLMDITTNYLSSDVKNWKILAFKNFFFNLFCLKKSFLFRFNR